MTSPDLLAPPSQTVHVEAVMGTTVSFDLRGPGDHAAAVAEAVAWFHEVDRRFSPYRPDGEVAACRRGALRAQGLSADLAEIVRACDEVERRSGGAFSAQRSDGFDPSAYVKGWSVDRAGAILEEHGCTDWSVNAGGDVRVASSGRLVPWRIGVQHPTDRSAIAAVLHARDLAVATSGRYERGDHLDDPRTGRAADAVLSATVCGPQLGLADAYATAAFVLGEDGPAWVAGIPGYECWSALPGGRVLATAGFPRLIKGVPVRTAPPSDLLETIR